MSHADETIYYALYLNANRSHGLFDDVDETSYFEQDFAKAKAAMEREWLEEKPVTEVTDER
jgi:hypothetical protein